MSEKHICFLQTITDYSPLCLFFQDKLSMAHYTERIINFKDAFGETPLHYATQQPNQVSPPISFGHIRFKRIFFGFWFLTSIQDNFPMYCDGL
jgi:hypothetical protein